MRSTNTPLGDTGLKSNSLETFKPPKIKPSSWKRYHEWKALLEDFGEKGRGQIYPPGLKVYVRITRRYINDERCWDEKGSRTLELATVDANEPGNGAFTKWLPEFEAFARQKGLYVYVENVLTDRFQKFWEKRGYHKIENSPGCYWIDPDEW